MYAPVPLMMCYVDMEKGRYNSALSLIALFGLYLGSALSHDGPHLHACNGRL